MKASKSLKVQKYFISRSLQVELLLQFYLESNHFLHINIKKYRWFKMYCRNLSMDLALNWRVRFLIFLTLISQARTADVMLIILSEKNNVQNPFVTAFMQGISMAQANGNDLTFDYISVVLDR